MFKADTDARLTELGRRTVVARLYERRQREISRQIVNCVHRHINASASELKERLEEILNQPFGEPSEAQIEAEIAKLR
jgi:hypothetical protein